MTHTAQHTPGLWAVKSTDEDINTKTIIDSHEFWIAKVLNFNRASDDIRESQANANLIAAAPTMYADLCAVRDYLFELYDEGNAKAGEYAASLGITIEQAEGRHHE